MSEIERLRADLEVIKRLRGQESSFWTMGQAETLLTEEIARLEAEAADPWRDARKTVEKWRRLDDGGPLWDPERKTVAYIDHLTAERDRLAARVAELENEPEPAKVSLRRADEIKLGDQIVTSGEIRTVDAISRHDEKFKVQLCSLGWGSWFEPSAIVAVINSADFGDPVLDPARVLATAETALRARQWHETADIAKFIWQGIDRNAKPYRLKGASE